MAGDGHLGEGDARLRRRRGLRQPEVGPARRLERRHHRGTRQPDRRAAQLPGELEGARYRDAGVAGDPQHPRLMQSVETSERM
ncbi:hypothetical protein SPHINGO8AM_20038 [Sphingomonas sp. 8AM]|nr:hypothetical protein SPHINGO8AM_20038 [Sphingomonas sp. 8AM]